MNTQKLLDLASELECNVVYNEPLSKHTTFRTGGACTAMVDISSEESLAKLVRAAHEWNVRYIVVGNGSNLLFDDRGYEGVVFLMGQSVDEIKMMNENTIYAEAGCSLIKLCRFALEHNLTGLEFAYGIPGTVGGAIYMNAGAYDGEIKNVITSANSVRADGSVHTTEANKMALAYRSSCYQKNGEVITSGVFRLEAGAYDDIQDKMVELMGRRRSKQPLEYPSAGSTFKRPEGQFAGKLIEDCGLRGYTVGGAQVSEKHCGFVVNKGGATTEDIMSVIRHVQHIVKEQTGYLLECEVKIIPYKE